MKTRLYLDKRSRPVTPDGEEPLYPVKVSISSGQRTAYIGTGVRLRESEWSRAAGNARNTSVRIKLEERRIRVEKALEGLRLEGRLHGLDVTAIKDLAAERMRRDEEGERNSERAVLDCIREYARGKDKEGTAGVYMATARRIEAFPGYRRGMSFREVTPVWLRSFEAFLSETAPSANARGIHLRNIRAVFNDAIRRGYTGAGYPFTDFKIKTEPTGDRSMTPEELRAYFSAGCSDSQAYYRDILLLSLLLCGINLEDLLAAKALRGGRLEAVRIKTGQPISIGVPAEALAIIGRHKGRTHLLDVYDRCSSYKSFQHRMNVSLKTVGMLYNPRSKVWEGEPLQPGISYYWMRYSWATVAAELDIPERTIGAALAHSTARTVTSIYTRVDMRKKIDAANRAVIDHIFGGTCILGFNSVP